MKLNAGDKFGDWTVIREVEPYHPSGARAYLCRCVCGNERIVRAERLISGKSKSCGCVTTRIEDIVDAKPTKANTSGFRGVSWNRKDQKWEANITYKNERKYLGQYDNKEDATQARKSAEAMLKRTGSL